MCGFLKHLLSISKRLKNYSIPRGLLMWIFKIILNPSLEFYGCLKIYRWWIKKEIGALDVVDF